MPDPNRLGAMIRLAKYEEYDGKHDLRIRNYYRRDYLAVALLKNFFAVTFAYGAILVFLLLYNLDYLMDNFNNLHFKSMFTQIVLWYFVALALYSVLVFVLGTIRYNRARRNMKAYYERLESLSKMYESEDRKKIRDQRDRLAAERFAKGYMWKEDEEDGESDAETGSDQR